MTCPRATIDSSEHLPRFASELDMPAVVKQRVLEYTETVSEKGLATGRHPAGVAAARLYAAAQPMCYQLTQQQANDIAGVTMVTLRATYVELKEGV